MITCAETRRSGFDFCKLPMHGTRHVVGGYVTAWPRSRHTLQSHSRSPPLPNARHAVWPRSRLAPHPLERLLLWVTSHATTYLTVTDSDPTPR
eukprot:2195060-Rhodomonas_salina.1